MAVVSNGRSALAVALCAAFASSARAEDYPHGILVEGHEAWMLMPGDTVWVSGPASGRAVTVSTGGTLDASGTDIVNRTSGGPGGYAFGILAFDRATASLDGSRIVVEGDAAIAAHAQGGSTILLKDVHMQVTGRNSMGIRSRADSQVVGHGLVLTHAGAGSRTSTEARGAFASDGGSISLTGSVVATQAPGVDAITVIGAGTTLMARGTSIVAAGEGAAAITLSGGSVAIHGGEVRGAGHAVKEGAMNTSPSSIGFDDGSHIVGRIESLGQPMAVSLARSSLTGDIVGGGRGNLSVRFRESAWQGRAERVADITIDGGHWQMSGDSSVQRLSLGSDAKVAFDERVPMGSLRVGALDNAAGGGTIVLRSRLDAGGALARQRTDRLLVGGDVTGTTGIAIVNAGGVGMDTSPLTDAPRAGDGISIAQVGGAATATSFHLLGGYVAAGPWQYGLVAYAPGQADVSQRLVEGRGNDHWDFRLQSRRSDDADASADGRGAARPGRALLVPQVPTYLVLSNALFGYGSEAVDALQPVDSAAPRDAGWHARAFGGHATYRSNLPFERYAVDYARTDRGLQVAGDLMAWAAGENTMRAGLAWSTGTSRIGPRAVDGISGAAVRARGAAVTYAAATEGGWRIHASYGFRHYRIDVDTPSRGEVLARLRGNANEASLRAGFRWDVAEHLVVEPMASLLWQRLRFVGSTDREGLDVRLGSPERIAWRGGIRASLPFASRGQALVAWAPYVDARYVATRGSGESIDISHVRFRTGRAGRAAELAAGVAMRFRADLTASVDATKRTRLGRAGESGWNARAGIVYTF
jgi:outer membrane autotransporter protein